MTTGTMKAPDTTANSATASEQAQERFLACEGQPLFVADWEDVLFVHYSIDPGILQPSVPFPLKPFEGRAWITLVAFTMRRLRPRRGGVLGRCLFTPLATTRFLNVRTYVEYRGEPGIFFLAEYISNRLATPLGSLTYGLPYRHAGIQYDCPGEANRSRTAQIEHRRLGNLKLMADTDPPKGPAPADPRARFLIEQYTAYTARRHRRHRFRIWHRPWALRCARVQIVQDTLLRNTFDWYRHAGLFDAHVSPGVHDVWMSRPTRIAAEERTAADSHHRHQAFLELP